MTETELRRVEVFSQVARQALRLIDATEILQVSYRQVKRLWRRYRLEGAAGLQHRSAGRNSNRAKPEGFRQQVLHMLREKYGGQSDQPCFGPTLAAEHLAEEDGLQIDAETLRRWMLTEGLWSRQRGRPRAHRKRRPRKEHFGELVQLDGSFHHWFEQRGPKGCLMNMVDDATGITQAYLGKEETTWAAVAVLRSWIVEHGVPLALYTDWKNVYKIAPTPKQELCGEEPLTQFGRMCAQLGIRILAAHSPQAKGRVERKNGVHQDRLVKKLRRKAMDSYEQANLYLQTEYLPAFNRRFAQSAARPENYHRRTPESADLNAIFRLQTEHWVSNDWVLRHQGRLLQLLPERRSHSSRRSKAMVYENAEGQWEVSYGGKPIAFREIAVQPWRQRRAERAAVPHVPSPRGRSRPTLEHPFKRHADQEIKQRRRQLLAQAAAARRAVGSASALPAVANDASSGSAPAPPTEPPATIIDISQGTLLTS
jgi:transposase